MLQFDAGALQFFLGAGCALDAGLFRFPDFLQIGVLAFQLGDVSLQRFKALARRLVGFLFQGFLLDLELDDATLQTIHRLRLGVDFDANAARGLVDQIDGLVRELAVGDVAM